MIETDINNDTAFAKEGYKDTKLGLIPQEWVYSSIRDFINQLNGFAFKSDEFNQENKGTRLCRGINITRGNLRFGEKNEMFWENSNNLNLEKYLLQDGDIVISMDGSLVGRNYSLVEEEFLPLLLVQRVARLRTKTTMSQSFLFHWISSNNFIRYVDSVKTSSGIPHISAKDINNFAIAIPPLPEQQKIASILNTWDKAIVTQEKLITQKQALKIGLMQQLLSGEKRFPGFTENWKYEKIGSYINQLNGFAFKSEHFNQNSEGVRLCRGINITRGNLRFDDKNEMYWNDSNLVDLKKYLLKESDIVISMDGSLVGRNFSLIRQNDLPLLLVQRIARLRTTKKMVQSYLFHWISGGYFTKYVDSVKTSSGIPHISSKDINNFKIAIPSIEEQEEIANILSQADKEILRQKEKQGQLIKQKQGLMQQLLTGKKRVNTDG
jgi:type I restriction enzyme S subunit